MLSRRGLAGLTLLPFLSPCARAQEAPAAIMPAAEALGRIQTLLVARDGQVVLERRFAGPGPDQPVNIKSLAKSVISALVGIAIDRKLLSGPDQPIAPLLEADLPARPDPRLMRITIGNLLSMQAGLERTSGPNYGRWVGSRNWVEAALAAPFVDEPGGGMLYSTGNTHLLSAILTRVADASTLEIARAWLGRPLDIQIPPWQRDPQGIFVGGNNMLLSPRGLLRFGELYRQRGAIDGRRVLPSGWIEQSWTGRTRSVFTGDAYGYGWFQRPIAGTSLFYGWGYGGQMLYVLPERRLTIVITSTPDMASGRDGYAQQLHQLVAQQIVPTLAG